MIDKHTASYCSFDGKQLASTAPCFSSQDRLLLAHATFTTLRIKDSRPVWLSDHAKRLKWACQQLGIAFAQSTQALTQTIQSLCAANNLTNCGCRITISYGDAPRGLTAPSPHHSHVLLTVFPLPAVNKNYSLEIASKRLAKNYSLLTQLKTAQYLQPMLAKQAAQKVHADDALLLNTSDRIAEATTSNLFMIKHNELITPPICEGAYPGLSRAKLLQLASSFHLKAIVRPVTLQQLQQADSLFLSNCLWPLQPISRVGNVHYQKKQQNLELYHALATALNS